MCDNSLYYAFPATNPIEAGNISVKIGDKKRFDRSNSNLQDGSCIRTFHKATDDVQALMWPGFWGDNTCSGNNCGPAVIPLSNRNL